MSELDELRAAAEKVLSEHFRGDWSDGTYSCHGCRHRQEQATEAAWPTAAPTERRAMLDASRAAVKPNWTVDDYNRHVAEHIAEALRPLLDRLERAEGKVARVWEYLDDVANPQAPGWPTLNVTRLVAALEPAPDALAADLPGAEGR